MELGPTPASRVVGDRRENPGVIHRVVVGLITPRHLQVVHGREDKLFTAEEVDRAAGHARRIWDAAGVSDRFAHAWGESGHRFYKHLMWPFIERAMAEVAR